jgi:hypothetical protein
MDDYSAICNLEGHYAHTWDTGDADGWAALFTSDGAFEMTGVGDRPSVRYTGPDELAQFCRSIHQRVKGLHLMHTPAIDVSGDEAEGWVHFEFRSRDPRDGYADLSSTMGVYHVRYLRTPDGWRMQERIETAVSRNTASYFAIPEA